MRFEMSTGIQTGGKLVFITWSVIVKIGLFPDKEHGVYQSRYSTEKMEHQLSRKKQLIMFLNYSVNTALIFGLRKMQKIYYRKALRPHTARTERLQKKQIL